MHPIYNLLRMFWYNTHYLCKCEYISYPKILEVLFVSISVLMDVNVCVIYFSNIFVSSVSDKWFWNRYFVYRFKLHKHIFQVYQYHVLIFFLLQSVVRKKKYVKNYPVDHHWSLEFHQIYKIRNHQWLYVFVIDHQRVQIR